MKNLLTTIYLVLFALTATAQDTTILNKMRRIECESSQVERYSYLLLDLAGSRLAGSDGAERGYKIAREAMAAMGLSNARVEFARVWHRGGFDIDKSYAAMSIPYYQPFFPAIVGWTGGTKGLQKGEVVIVEDADSTSFTDRYHGKLGGKIVLMPSRATYAMNFSTPSATRISDENLEKLAAAPTPEPTAMQRRNRPPQQRLIDWLRAENPLAIVNCSGDFNNPGVTFFNHQQGDKPIAPEFNLAVESYGLMKRLVENGERVVMELDFKTRFTGERPIKNVVAEIEGTDLKDELVIIGGHIDSYHLSPGAGDDAAGCIVMMEAMRLLKEAGVKPRRTIRIVLWGGEEMGLHGSAGYVEQFVGRRDAPLKEHSKISCYINSDYGPGKFRGIYTQANEAAYPIFATWLAPFKNDGCSTVSNLSVGSTDHISFDIAGIPAFQFISDNLEWGRASHRVTDFADRMIYADTKHNALVVAWLAYCAAMSDEKMPRK